MNALAILATPNVPGQRKQNRCSICVRSGLEGLGHNAQNCPNKERDAFQPRRPQVHQIAQKASDDDSGDEGSDNDEGDESSVYYYDLLTVI